MTQYKVLMKSPVEPGTKLFIEDKEVGQVVSTDDDGITVTIEVTDLAAITRRGFSAISLGSTVEER